MMTVNEVSKLSGVSIRSLHYYDKIGLLPATEVTAAGYRLYDDKALERLQMILLFKELQFPLKEITMILDSPDFDRNTALEQQIRLLELRRDHLEDLIALARGIKTKGVRKMSRICFEDFDTRRIDEYAAQAKASWGMTGAYREFEQKSAGRSKEEEKLLGMQMMEIFEALGKIRHAGPGSEEAQVLVRQLQDFITSHYYTCTDEILLSLGQMYAGGGDMTDNIDKYAGSGTAAFACEAIDAYLLAKRGR
ncbi:MAG: MerR family transcriptional regulator [Clostridia bacterium]|nr:MerR family transcriptional regulator [Clostridia bacterium]